MPVITLPRAPLTRPIVAGVPDSAPVKSVPWREWFDHLKVVVDTIGSTSGGGGGTGSIIEGTHAARLASYPPAANVGAIYIETDRNRVMYVSDGLFWNYQGGTIITTLAGMLAIAAGLGVHDKNLTFYSVLFDRTYQWDGTVIGEINARDRSIHMQTEAPSTAGYALCDGSTVTRSRPDGTTYSWVTPDLTGLLPKFGASYSGVANPAVPPTLHVGSTIPAGTFTHSHTYDGSTGNAVDNDNNPWYHRHYIDVASEVDTTVAYDGGPGAGSSSWVITGTMSGGSSSLSGGLNMPNHAHIFPAHTLTSGAKNGDETGWAPSGGITGSADGTTNDTDISHDHSFSGTINTSDPDGTIGNLFQDFEFGAVAASGSHHHTGSCGGNTDGGGGSHAHDASLTVSGSFVNTSADHVHVLDELGSGGVVGTPVAIDISTLSVNVSGISFTSTSHAHHHTIDITGSSTGDGTDSGGEDAAPHHHTYEGTTDARVQEADFDCTVTATADTDTELPSMQLMGYISL